LLVLLTLLLLLVLLTLLLLLVLLALPLWLRAFLLRFRSGLFLWFSLML